MKRILGFALLLGLVLLGTTTPARAQGPDPSIQVFNELVGAGYDVIQVGNYRDAQGNPDPNVVFAQMETITADFSDRYLINETLNGFKALNKYYSAPQTFLVLLHYDHWLFFLLTTPQEWDDFAAKRVTTAEYWNRIGSQARIYDTTEQKYINAKDFSHILQTSKTQTNKDFSGQGSSPLPPINTNPDAAAENILLEPSTTYLPADGSSQAYLLATLTDQNFSGLPGRGVTFTYEVQGQDEKQLPAAQTDKFGTARSKISSSRALDAVLLRAATATLNATTQILVQAPPGKDAKARAKAVVDGLTSQGYRDVDADYVEYTGPAGDVIRQGIAAVRVTSKAFDREVYSQLTRMLGTLRTVMPDANFLRPILLYAAADGHDYAMLFTLRADIWDAYLRGDIGENQLWASLSYDGAVNENGVRTNEKDFLSKNFSGTNQPTFSSVAREVESSITTEEWGDQLNVGSFLVPVGGYADTFTLGELSGSATGFTIFATPNYNQPVFTYNKGDDAALAALRLEAGQYVVSVEGANPPAKVMLQYMEHLAR